MTGEGTVKVLAVCVEVVLSYIYVPRINLNYLGNGEVLTLLL